MILIFCYILSTLVPGSSINVGILSDQTFASLEGSVSDLTLKAVEEMGFKKMTEIQVFGEKAHEKRCNNISVCFQRLNQFLTYWKDVIC